MFSYSCSSHLRIEIAFENGVFGSLLAFISCSYKGGSNQSLVDIDFTCSIFYVQVHGLPLKFLTFNNVEQVGSLVEVVNHFQESHEHDIGDRKFLHLNVEVDISKPLASSFFPWVQFRYQHLLNFCYYCGKLGHLEGFCSIIPFM